MPDHNLPTWPYTLPAALLLMAPFDILASLAMDIYLPVVPEMPGILGTSPAIVQLTLSLYMLMLGLGQVLFGPLSDRFGRRPVLLGGATLFALTSLLLAVTTSAPVFVALGLRRRRAPRRRWSRPSRRCGTSMAHVRKASPYTASSAPCCPSFRRSDRLPAR